MSYCETQALAIGYGAPLLQDIALHAERGTAQPACPQTGAGGVVAAGAHFQQHSGEGCKRGRQQQPAACRQQSEIQHKAAQFQVGHRRLCKDSIQRGRR